MSNNPTTTEEARAAERERIKAILTDPVAQDRRQAAEALAFGSSMPAADAVALLATLDAGAPKTTVTGPRAKDAPGGLVVADGASLPAGATEAVITAGPDEPPKPGASSAQALWRAAIAKVNREMKAG